MRVWAQYTCKRAVCCTALSWPLWCHCQWTAHVTAQGLSLTLHAFRGEPSEQEKDVWLVCKRSHSWCLLVLTQTEACRPNLLSVGKTLGQVIQPVFNIYIRVRWMLPQKFLFLSLYKGSRDSWLEYGQLHCTHSGLSTTHFPTPETRNYSRITGYYRISLVRVWVTANFIWIPGQIE